MDGGDGVEPSFRESKSRVLPLNEPPIMGSPADHLSHDTDRSASTTKIVGESRRNLPFLLEWRTEYRMDEAPLRT